MALVDASQLDELFLATDPFERDSGSRRFRLKVDGVTLQILGNILTVGVISSSNLAPGAVDASAISFDSGDIPHSSPSILATDVEAALEETALGYLSRLPLTGGTLSGPLAMGTNQITGLADPTADDHAVNYGTLTAKISEGKFLHAPVGFGAPAVANGSMKLTWVRANASVYFSGNPSPGDTAVIHGVTLIFSATPGVNKILIGATPAMTAANMAGAINANASVTLDGIPMNVQFYAAQASGDGEAVHIVCKNEDPPNTPEDGNSKQIALTSLVLSLVPFNGGLGSIPDGMLVVDLSTNTLYTYDEQDTVSPWKNVAGAVGTITADMVIYDGPALPNIAPTPDNLENLFIALDTIIGTGLPPSAHAASHQNPAGTDQINVGGLSGTLADPQDAGWLQGNSVAVAAPALNDVLAWNGVTWTPTAPSAPGMLNFFANLVGPPISPGEVVCMVAGVPDTVTQAIATAMATSEVMACSTVPLLPGALGPFLTWHGSVGTVFVENVGALAVAVGQKVWLSKLVAGSVTPVPPPSPCARKVLGIITDTTGYAFPGNPYVKVMWIPEPTFWLP